MKIYTRKGDQGETSLIGGTRVPKHHLRIEAYGTVDELNSWTGLLRDHVSDETVRHELTEIQDRLFTIGSQLAADPASSRMSLPDLQAADIVNLESAMDRMDATLPEMRNFVLPGGHPTVSYCHITRCVCRRAERLCVHLSESAAVKAEILQYLNRLSDYFFVLARKLAQDLGAEETPWKPRG
jgi:cob(I)alamin adenosyltransferase